MPTIGTGLFSDRDIISLLSADCWSFAFLGAYLSPWTKVIVSVPTNKLQLLLRVRTSFDPDNSDISLRLPNRNPMNFLDGAPTHQSIGYDPSSSAWSLAYHLHTQNGLHDRTNKGASFVIEPLSIADISCNRHL